MHAHGAPQFAAALWSQVNDIVGRRKLHKSPLDPALPLDDINNFFQAVAVSNNHYLAGSFMFPSVATSGNIFKFRHIEVSEVALLLRNLNIKKSTGPGGISSLWLRRLLCHCHLCIINHWMLD